MSKRITIARGGGWYGFFRSLTLLVDDKDVGALRRNQSITLSVPDAGGVLVGAMDWGRTEPFDLRTVPDGGTVTIRGTFTANELRNLGVTALPFEITLD